jgi:beta-lactamase regulating signal transducer with metallopeptidase domain
MYYFLLNATIIWLASLLVYEFLLKQETFHRQNRLYLLCTFVLGILLPLLPWQQHVTLAGPLQRLQIASTAAATKGTGVQQTAAATPELSFFDPARTLWLLYLTGVIVAGSLLLRECLQLYSAYRKGSKTRSEGWIIIETGGSHNPYSFLKCIFVSKRQLYSDSQWQMLLQHEQAHYHKRHLFDLILLQTACIVCWFHPLVYYYRNRLRLLHEYEVDRNAEADVAVYGRFLLEQALLNRAPAMTHSFDYSPIKDRIMMLTKQSSAPKMRLKMLLTLPLIAGFAMCCAQSKSDLPIEIKGDGIALKGNQIAFSKAEYDTIIVQDPDSHEWRTLVAGKRPKPIELNGLKVNPYFELANKPVSSNGSCLRTMMTELNLVRYLGKLPDGKYIMRLDNVLVNKEGRIVYFENAGYYKAGGNFLSNEKPSKLDKQDETVMDQKMTEYLLSGGLTFNPGEMAGSKAPFLAEDKLFISTFQVANHQVTITDK